MRSATFRSIILGSTLLISVIILTQLFLLRKQYDFEQKQFSLNVVKAIRGLYEDLNLSENHDIKLAQLIEQPDEKTFLIKIDSLQEGDTIAYYLTSELMDFEVFADFSITVYNNNSQQTFYKKFFPAGTSRIPVENAGSLPPIKTNYSCIQLYFPHRNQYVWSEMKWWIMLSSLLLLLLIGLGVSIFFLYRQKFLNEIQSDFIKNVTHEFQTPLTTLTLGLDMLSKPDIFQQPLKMEKFTSVMRSQTEYLKSHMEKLMKVISTDANGMELKKELINPQDLIKSSIHQLQFLVDEKQTVIHYEWNADNKCILADKENVYLSILNVISNAIKFSKTPVITITTTFDGSNYVISVKDNGIGIETESQKKLFKKFYRIPSGNLHDVKGLGLGLYFVKKIVDAHKGKITVSSKPGEGSEFKLFFPL